jgi:competence protein ComEC
MNAKASPFVILLIPLAAGIWLGSYLKESLFILSSLLGFVVVFLIYLYPKPVSYAYRWLFGVGCVVALFLTGICMVILSDERGDPHHFAQKGISPVFFCAEVYDVPTKAARLKVPVRLLSAGKSPEAMQPCSGNVLLYIEEDSVGNRLEYGDRILAEAKISKTEGPKNPYAFDYGQYLHYQNIHYTAFVRTDSLCLLSQDHGNIIWKYAYRCRANLLEILRTYFPTQDEYAVASALLVGYKDDLSEDLRTAYAETGSMHALAVSGTHVGFLYMGLVWLLRRIPVYGYKGKLMEILIALVVIWVFTFITGATASVLRASVMFSIFLLGQAIFRYANVWNIMASSAFMLLLINPYYLFDAGFQLSYAAVAGMVFFYPLFYKRSNVRNKFLDMAWQTLLVGFAAQLGTLPLTLYYFHQFPVYFWLAGWIVVLGGAVFLGGGTLLIVLHSICSWWDWPAAYLGKLLFWMLYWMNKIIMAIQQLPGSVIRGIWLSTWASWLLLSAVVCYGIALYQQKGKPLLVSMGIVTFLLLCNAVRATQQTHQRKIAVYHVGNGARMIDFFDGAYTISLSDTLSRKQMLFSAQSNRWANGQIGVQQAFFSDKSWRARGVVLQGPFIQFYDKKIAIVDTPEVIKESAAFPVAVQVLILSKNPQVSISDCLKCFRPEQIIADPSNSRKSIQKWKEACVQLKIPFHDIKSQGAWVQQL